jgi:hypothetical protein
LETQVLKASKLEKSQYETWSSALATASSRIPLTKQKIPDPSGGAAPCARPGLEEPSPPLLSTAAESCRKILFDRNDG